MRQGVLCLAVLLGSATSAAAQTDALAPEQLDFFERRIRPLFIKHCYSCHSRTAKKLRGDLLLDTRAGLRAGGETGPAVVAGKPDESLLIQAVRHDGDVKMPPDGKLSRAEIDDLVAWVKMGAPDPRTEEPRPNGPAKKAGIDLEAGKRHWSLQPLRPAAEPAVRNAAWVRSPVDRFILAKLEGRGMAPAPAADPATLIRRLYFDLLGLPPPPEEVEEFVRACDSGAKRQAALAGLVDRLLESPHHGERWGRHWLDVVRYADTAGDNSDYPIPQLYRYRNWVIDAFNRDLPYDEFIRLQLAGDLIPSEPNDYGNHIATGYLANSRRHGSYEDARYPWHLTIEDTIDNVGKAFLGVTLHCARCHDHKFDPFSAEDYYALYGFFSSTRYPWPGIELDKTQRDLVPLTAPAEVARRARERQEKLAGMDAAIGWLEADQAALRHSLRDVESQPATETETPAAAQLREHIAAAGKAIQSVKKARERAAKAPPSFELAYAVIDGTNEPKKRIGQVANARVMLKGDPERLGKEVPRRFPLVLGGQTLGPGTPGSGRLQLAAWIADPANPLTARVMVNRIWQYHFGRGLVATPNDFGKQGQLPSHPELLDDLARRFIASGWSMKAVHRLIVLSATYQQASADPPSADPENILLSRFPRRRLDAETIRDSILAVSGSLDRSRGEGHPFPPMASWDFTQHKPFKAVYDSQRRSVYLMTQRIQRHPFLALFDGPDTNASTATRTVSTTSLQALFLMNDPFVHDQACRLAARLLGERSSQDDRIDRAFRLALGRPPTPDEQQQVRTFIGQAESKLRASGTPASELAARTWESVARAVFMSSEFIYVD